MSWERYHDSATHAQIEALHDWPTATPCPFLCLKNSRSGKAQLATLKYMASGKKKLFLYRMLDVVTV